MKNMLSWWMSAAPQAAVSIIGRQLLTSFLSMLMILVLSTSGIIKLD